MDEEELNLPVEIIEHVLFYLDGSSMVRAGTVNTTWRTAYLNVLKHKNLFEACCKSEISPEGLLAIVERLYPAYVCKTVGEIDWFRVYKCWHFWKNVEKWIPSVQTLIEEYCCQIKCITLSGDWLIYGTVLEGKLELYNMKTKVKSLFYKGFGIVDIDLRNCIDNSVTNTSDDTNERFHHDYIVLFLKNNYVLSLPFNHVDDMIEQISDSNLVYSDCSALQWLQRVRNNNFAKLKSLGYHTEESNLLTSTVQTRYFVTINSEGRVHLGDSNGDAFDYCEIGFKGYENITNWYQLSSNVSFGVAFKQFHMLFFVVGDEIKPYIPCPSMFSIKTAFLHCNMLFLGSSKGIVYMYRLNGDDSLLSLRLSKYTQKYKVAGKCIVGIDVQYTKDNKPCIVVATESSIHEISENIFENN